MSGSLLTALQLDQIALFGRILVSSRAVWRLLQPPVKVEETTVTVSDQILSRLHAWGVRRVYGYPGDGINGLMGAFDRIGDKMDFVQTRHEELAAFAATAHAKFTGEVGVCMATSGPGAIHLLNGLYDAKADHQPVVAIVGQAARICER
jgi:pyruvate dehydrogenase (quinone)